MTDFQNLFEACGKFYRPGKEPQGNPISPITPTSYDPTGTGGGDPPLKPTEPVSGGPLYKCEEVDRIFCPEPNGLIVEKIVRECIPCRDSGGALLISPVVSPAGFEECMYRERTCTDEDAPPCVSELFDCPGTPVTYKCEETVITCPEGTVSNGNSGGPITPNPGGSRFPGYPATDPFGNPIDPNGSPQIKQILRQCIACGPGATDPECKYLLPSCNDPGLPPCNNSPVSQCITKPTTGGGGGGSGPITGAGFKCVTQKQFCPPGTVNEGSFIRITSRLCNTCNFGDDPVPPTGIQGGSYQPQTTTKPTILVPSTSKEETPCQFQNLNTCRTSCPTINNVGPITQLEAFCNNEPTAASLEPTPNSSDNRPITPDPDGTRFGRLTPVLGSTESLTNLPNPFNSVTAPANELLNIQERNATIVNTRSTLIEEDFNELKNLRVVEKLYHPELNFFTFEPDNNINLVPNRSYLNVFNSEIDSSIQRSLTLANSTLSWSEKDFINITDEKIIQSLHPDLLTAFKIIRYPGGEVVGLSTFINMIKKHIVTGTVDKIDPSHYINIAKKQLQQNFTILETPLSKDHAERFTIDYISKNGESLTENKGDKFKNFQINRGRVLNEDLEISIPIETLSSSIKTLEIPNEGIPLSSLNPGTDTTPDSVGSPNLLNLGDGGGYYLYLSSLSGDVPLKTDNLLENSYYLPEYHKSKVLSLNGKTFQSTITASSLSQKHEFVSGDQGASSFEPMYFGLNLASVSSTYTDDPLIETYKATYSRITNTDQIARHVNNNAQSFSEFRIPYSDPLYRYILDTSSFELEQEDLTIYGFKQGYSSVNFNFPKNIPFAILILPAAGSKFNPFNANSTLISYAQDKLVRSLGFRPSINSFIDGREGGKLKQYNLYNKDKSTRIGLVEADDVQSFGYEYNPSAYYNTLFNGTDYVSSIEPVSSFGISYLLTEVLDYISNKTSSKNITWFDIFRRMPFNRFSELFYTSPENIFSDIKNGFRNNLKPNFVLKGLGAQESLILEDDEKVVVKREDRKSISTIKLASDL